jgi:hypothetical protein
MDCSEFLDRYSEFHDGQSEDAGQFEEHLGWCRSCRRYDRVIRQGVALLRRLPRPEISDAFGPRLQHRLYHLHDRDALARDSHGSGATTAVVFAMAILLAAAAWSPTVWRGEVVVELPPIVVSEAPRRPMGPVLRVRPLLAPEPATSRFGTDWLWSHTHSLLYEYSPLSDRYRLPVLQRTGLDE